MHLERRWSQRKEVKWDAIVLTRLSGLIRSKILNISLEGVHITTGGIRLPLNTLAGLSFALRIESHKRRFYQLKTLVIHQTVTGYGLMFEGLEQGILQLIHTFLNDEVTVAAEIFQ